MTPDNYIGLLIQIPLVGIFVWFSLNLINTFLKSIDERDKQWRVWMEQERRANNEAIAHMGASLTAEVRNLAQRIDNIRE